MLENMFTMQKDLQNLITKVQTPCDNVGQFHYSITALVCELGEVLQADKRWKNNGRNNYYDRDEKLEEFVDCFAFLINACLYSGYNAEEIYYAFVKKFEVNVERTK